MEQNKYLEKIDIARGIAVLLVIMGHGISDIYLSSMETYTIAGKWIFDLIYSFHMPLFVFLSGYCNYKVVSLKDKGSRAIFLNRRFQRLMVPYLVWGVLYVFLDIIGGNYTWHQFNLRRYLIDLICGDNANWQLWTLYTLFLCVCISVLLFSVCRLSVKWVTIISGIIFLIRVIIDEIHGLPYWLFITIIGFGTMYFFFFCLGIWIRLEGKSKKSDLPTTGWLIAIALLGLNAYGGTYFYYNMGLPTDWTKILGAPLGIYLVWNLSDWIKKKQWKKYFLFLGKNCMTIYIFANINQVIVRRISFLSIFMSYPRWIFLLISMTAAVLVPVTIDTLVLSRCSILKRVLLGEGK